MAGCNTFLVCAFFLLFGIKQLPVVLAAMDNEDQQRSVSTGGTSSGPLCYSCEWLTDPTTCGHKITCGRDELCMLHELLPGIDGSRRYKASCEAEKVCESLRNHAKRAHIFCHNCCKEDLCNNRCGSTTTLPTTTPSTTPTTTRTTTSPTTTKAPTTPTTTTPTTTTPTTTTPATTTPTTTTPATTTPATTTPATTTPSTTTPTTTTPTTTQALPPTTTHRVTYPIMCFSCSMMVDPTACKHLVSCGVGHLCNAISRFALVGKRGDGYEPGMSVDGASHVIHRRYSSCNKCCRKHLCNNHCDTAGQSVLMTTATPHTTVDDVSATTSYTTPHTAVQTTLQTTPQTTVQTTEKTTLQTTVSVHKTTSAPKTHPNVFSHTYVGCFPESQHGKFLTGQHWTSSAMTVKYCITFCKGLGFAYAGLEHGAACYCGYSFTSLPSPAPEDQCSYRCSGDIDYICGGNMYISVYKTQRLCYNCDGFTHPDQCKNVTDCPDDQVCSVYQTGDHLMGGGKLYHAGCSTQKACDVFSNLPSIHNNYVNTDFCHTCCSSPLCNNVCTVQVTHAPTTPPTTTASVHSGDKCKQNGYVHIPYISLCFKLEKYTFSHSSAERWCEQFGATLAILDDPGKFSVLQTLLKVDPTYVNQIVYIGGDNRYGNGTFYWPDGRHVTVGGWSGSTTALCLSMDGTNGFRLRAIDCTAHLKFICTVDVS